MASNVHGMLQYHNNAIQNMCRICGNRSQNWMQVRNNSAAKSCLKYSQDIKVFYGVDVMDDDSSIHPPNICASCYRRMMNAKYRETNSECDKSWQVENLWIPHKRSTTSDMCPVFKRFDNQRKGCISMKKPK